jgi:hypothetical protein
MSIFLPYFDWSSHSSCVARAVVLKDMMHELAMTFTRTLSDLHVRDGDSGSGNWSILGATVRRVWLSYVASCGLRKVILPPP